MLYAKTMFKLLEEGKRIINIDESWIDRMDFRNRSWRERGQLNTISSKNLSHNINMIAAIDTNGKVYLSLTQQNTDNDMMLTFLSRLALLLSQEDKEWRTETIWLLDNAPYHRSKLVQQHLRQLGMLIVLSGQYAYSAAPCELFFAYYKREHHNLEEKRITKT